MKKLFFAFAAGLLLLAGCAKEYDDTALKEKVDAIDKKVTALQAEVDKLKSDVSGISTVVDAWKNADVITKVEEIKEGDKVTGYTLTFKSGKTISLFNGKDGANAPVIGTKKDGDQLYWTVGGEYLIVDGKKVPVNVVPSFELKDGHLWVTIGGVAQDLGAVSEGSSVDGIIKSIVPGEKTVVFTLNGNPETVFEIPLAKPFGFEFAQTEFAVLSTDPIEIAYTLNGKTEKTTVGVFATASLPAVIDAEKVVVTPAFVDAKGDVLVYAANHEGQSDIAVLSFGPQVYQNTDAAPEDPEGIYEDDVDYVAAAVDGAVAAHVTTNVEISVKSEAEWITIGEITKASYTINLILEDNPKDAVRYGNVKVVLKNDEAVVLQDIKIAQAPGEPQSAEGKWVLNLNNPEMFGHFFISDADAFKGLTAFTIEVRMNANSLAKDGKDCRRLMRICDGNDWPGYKQVLLRFANGNNGEGILTVNQNATDNVIDHKFASKEWVTISIVSDGSTVTVYDNGEVAGTFSSLSNFNLDAKYLELGMSMPSHKKKQAFDGLIDYVRLWNVARSQSEVKAALCADALKGSEEGLLANFVFEAEGEKPAVIKDEAHNLELDFAKMSGGVDNDTAGNPVDLSAVYAEQWVDYTEVICVPAEPEENGFRAPDFSGQNVWGWVKFDNAISLPDGFTYVFHYRQNKAATGVVRIGNFADADENWINMLRINQAGIGGTAFGAFVGPNGKRGDFNHSETAAEAGKWHQAALVWDAAAKTYKIAIDAKFVTNDALDVTAPTFQAIEFGESWDGSSRFDGQLCEISVWDKPLTEKELYAVYGEIKDPATVDNLKAYWPMHEGNGVVFAEATGKYQAIDFATAYSKNGKTVKPENITWTKENEWEVIPEPVDPPQPSGNKAANTNTNKVWFDTNITGEYSALTFETILRGDDFDGEDANINTIFGKEGEWLLRAGDSGISRNQLQVAKKGGNWNTKLYFEKGKWYHIAVTYDSVADKCVLYVNGVEYDSEEGKSSLAVNFDKDSNGYGCFVSRSYGMKRWWRGAFTEMRVWNKVRTAEEIKANMLPGSVQDNAEGLLGYWKFNEGEGNTVKDYSGNSKDLEAQNGDIVWEDAEFKLKDPVLALTDAEWTIEADEEGNVTFKTCDAAKFKAVVVKGVKKESLTPGNVSSYVKDAEILDKVPVVVSYETISSGSNCAIIAEVDEDGDITGKYSALDFTEPEHLVLKSDWEIVFNGYDVNKSANSYTINSCSSEYYYALITDEADPLQALEVVKGNINGMYYWNASASSGLPATHSIGKDDPEEGYIYVFGLNRNSWNVAVSLDYNVIQYKKENILSVSEVIAAEDNATVKFAGYVAAVSSDSAIITDNSNHNIYVYRPATVPAVGDMVFVEGKKVTYTAKNCTVAIVEVSQGATVEVKSSGNEIKYPAAKNITASIDEYAGLENKSSELIALKGTITVSGNFTNLVIDGASRQGSPKSADNLSAYNGKTAKMTGYFVGTSGNPDLYVNFIVVNYTILEPGNSVPEMANRYLTVDWGTQDVSALDKVTVEWEMNADAWNTTYQYSNYWGTQTGHSDVNTVFGVEGKWLLRIGDAGIANNNLELADHNHPRAGVDFKTNTWYHCAVTYNTEDGTTKFYVNGKLVNSCEGTATSAADLTGALVGCSYKDNGVNSRYFNGRLANIRVWNTVRSEKEINEGIKNFTDVANANLLMYFKLDECSDNLVNSATASDVKLTPDQELEWKQGRPDEEVEELPEEEGGSGIPDYDPVTGFQW